MSDTHRSTARFDGDPPEGLLRQTAGYLRAYDLPLELGDTALTATFSEACVRLQLDGAGFSLDIRAGNSAQLPRWPEVNEKGRTVWPTGDEALHRATYTFVDLDAAEGWFSFDVFEHAGGLATGWARAAQPGDIVGIMGPGGGDFPQADHMVMGGDETALPAIRRILEHAPRDRRGEVFIELADPADRCPLALPEGMRLTWLTRGEDAPLKAHMLAAELPGPEESRFVWFAAEAGEVRAARQYFREEAGLGRQEMYLSAYWTA